MKPWSQGWLIAAGAYPGFCSIKRLEVFPLLLDRMLVHRRSLPRNFVRFPQQIAGTHLYTWVERGTVRVKCLAQEHNTLSPARARTRTARSGVERTNHEATAPPTEPRSGEVNILPLFTEIEKNNCFSIYTGSDLNNIFRRKPLKIDLIDLSIHAWKTCKRYKACANSRNALFTR